MPLAHFQQKCIRELGRGGKGTGFTLTEMLVVIVILGLIAAVITPQVMGQMGRARAKAAKVQLETVVQAVEQFYADVGRYPSSEEGLAVLLQPPAEAIGWAGPYLRSADQISDPWGQALRYIQPDAISFRIASLGADRAEGGEGMARDLVLP